LSYSVKNHFNEKIYINYPVRINYISTIQYIYINYPVRINGKIYSIINYPVRINGKIYIIINYPVRINLAELTISSAFKNFSNLNCSSSNHPASFSDNVDRRSPSR